MLMIKKYSIKFSKYYYNIYIDNNRVIKGYFTASPQGIVVNSLGENTIVDMLIRYFHGEAINFSNVQIDFPYGSIFEKNVWLTLRKIPYGEVRSYKWVAENIGKPKAYRAVGNAISKNPILVIIPCHRVIKSNGHIGGFTSIGGVELKRMLLRLEGVKL